MKESTTYQKILREGRQEGRQEGREEGETLGRVREARRFLRLQGTKKFGAPNSAISVALEEIEDVDRLEALGERILEADLHDWDDLLRGS